MDPIEKNHYLLSLNSETEVGKTKSFSDILQLNEYK